MKRDKSVLIYGAGVAGVQLANNLEDMDWVKVVGFLDDDESLHDHKIQGYSVYSPSEAKFIVGKFNVSEILLALPSIPLEDYFKVLGKLKGLDVHLGLIPRDGHMPTRTVSYRDIATVPVEDLLIRGKIIPDQYLLKKNVYKKSILVTGGGGSIGSELCRQVIAIGASELIIVDNSEFNLYQIRRELNELIECSEINVKGYLANVENEGQMREIIGRHKPTSIFHAAAYKHVSIVEENIKSAFINNIFGTLVVALEAINAKIENFIFISTDKAVRPTSIMGATKRVAEMVIQGLAENSTLVPKENNTNFSIVRFGNVLGSSGSVVPLFREQIQKGGPITLAHLDVTRFFMTIPEAAQLVIQASALAEGGEVFLLKMGDPIKIRDLAEKMIQGAGLKLKNEANPNGDIEIVISGLKPGEKLYEEMLISNNPQNTKHEKIIRGDEKYIEYSILSDILYKTYDCLEVMEEEKLRLKLMDLIQS